MKDHRSYGCNLVNYKTKAWLIMRLNRIWTHGLVCNTGVVLYQLSYQADRELVILWVCNMKYMYDILELQVVFL